jgi:hypothetical protein
MARGAPAPNLRAEWAAAGRLFVLELRHAMADAWPWENPTALLRTLAPDDRERIATLAVATGRLRVDLEAPA